MSGPKPLCGRDGTTSSVHPDHIVGRMDAISDGWQYGGAATANLSVQPWESMLDVPLAELRERVGIEPTRLAAKQEASRLSLSPTE